MVPAVEFTTVQAYGNLRDWSLHRGLGAGGEQPRDEPDEEDHDDDRLAFDIQNRSPERTNVPKGGTPRSSIVTPRSRVVHAAFAIARLAEEARRSTGKTSYRGTTKHACT